MRASLESADLLAQFTTVLRELKGEPHIAETPDAISPILKSIVESHEIKSIVCAGIPSELLDAVAKTADGNVKFQQLEKLIGKEAVSICEQAQAGITFAEFGIASQGALVEITYDDIAKLASSLPFTSIVLLPASRIVATLADATEKIRSLLRSANAAALPVISLISGPSKTSDIELKLLYGVHGPNYLHVIILNWM